jgi:hypothetical protein
MSSEGQAEIPETSESKDVDPFAGATSEVEAAASLAETVMLQQQPLCSWLAERGLD